MMRVLFIFVLLVAVNADAAPITLDKTERVAEARRDPGTGICGTVTKFTNQPMPLTDIEEAIALMNKPNGDANVAGRASRLFQNMNFSVGTSSEADFKAPMFNDDLFPLCQDPRAMPMGNDDNNIALRLRGYLNVPRANTSQTFALKVDDAAVVRIGKSMRIVIQGNDDSPIFTGRRGRWVTFTDPGLYPVEIVYFQNSTTGYLEWSRADGHILSGDDIILDNVEWSNNMGQFKPLAGTDLYSSIVGSNPVCTECGAPGMDCATGNFCGDGLCQPCNLSDHCGPSCMKCPADRAICSAGKCVQCTSDDMCPPGASCDFENGTCLPPMPCTVNSECRPPQICRPDLFCGTPPVPCATDAECLAGQICANDESSVSCSSQKICQSVPSPCRDDNQCASGFYCDIASQVCKRKRVDPAEGCGGDPKRRCQICSGPGTAPDGYSRQQVCSCRVEPGSTGASPSFSSLFAILGSAAWLALRVRRRWAR